jgi:O-antigen/teichoic acid export membrane protein
MPVHITCTQVFQVCERLGMMSALNMTLAVARLLAALIMIGLISEPTAQDLASYYLGATMLATVISVSQVLRIYGRPRWKRDGLGSDLRQSLHFSSSSIAQYVTANIDKSLLAYLSSTSAAGVYAAAQRVTEAALIPVFALMAAAIPRLFKHGEKGLMNSLSIARGLLPVLFLYTAITALGLFLVAPWLPRLFGPEYQQAESVGRWLAILPFLHMMHAVAGDTLSGAGYQRIRSIVEITAALLNVLMNFWLIQKYSFHGTAWALLASFTFSSASLWLVIARLSRK